jgi:hypothetical protein
MNCTAAPTAQEIYDQSQKAMGPPIKYNISTAGIEATVFKKQLPDGVLAIRTEMHSPVERVSLALDEKTYDIYPQKNVVVDTQFMGLAARKQAESVLQGLGGAAPGNLTVVGGAEEGRSNRITLESSITSIAANALLKALPVAVQERVPVKTHMVIDATSYDLLETLQYSSSGQLVARSVITEINRSDEIPNDLFLLPDAETILSPKSASEYASIIMQQLPPRKTGIPHFPKVTIPKPKHLGPITFDQNTGRPIAPVPPGVSAEEFAVNTAPRPRSASLEVTSMPESRQWGIWISASVVIFLSIVVVWKHLSLKR